MLQKIILIFFPSVIQVKSKDSPLPVSCRNYFWLDNPNRKTSYNGEYRCDQTGYVNVHPDWKGPNWYRIDPNIGTKIATSLTKPRHCETIASGWIQGPSTPDFVQLLKAKFVSILVINANILDKSR